MHRHRRHVTTMHLHRQIGFDGRPRHATSSIANQHCARRQNTQFKAMRTPRCWSCHASLPANGLRRDGEDASLSMLRYMRRMQCRRSIRPDDFALRRIREFTTIRRHGRQKYRPRAIADKNFVGWQISACTPCGQPPTPPLIWRATEDGASLHTVAHATIFDILSLQMILLLAQQSTSLFPVPAWLNSHQTLRWLSHFNNVIL